MQLGYKPSWIKISLLAFGIIVIITGVFFLVKSQRDRKNQEYLEDYSYEALVQVVDQTSDDPVIDRRLNLKRGDVLAVFPKEHDWAEAEKKSYLILKLKISPEEAAKLVEADVRDAGLVRLRAYRIKIENLNFDPAELGKGQPFEKKVFGKEIIEKK